MYTLPRVSATIDLHGWLCVCLRVCLYDLLASKTHNSRQCFFPFQVLAVRPLGLRSFISGGEFDVFFSPSLPLESSRFYFYFTSFSIDLIFFSPPPFTQSNLFFFKSRTTASIFFFIMARYGVLLPL